MTRRRWWESAVDRAVQERMEARESFTALDISNMLIAYGVPVRHRPVAKRVRALYNSGAIRYYDYRRHPIEALAGKWARPARTFLYHHARADPEDYALRLHHALQPTFPPQRSQRDDRRRSRSDPADHCGTALIRRPGSGPRRRFRRRESSPHHETL